MLVLGYDTGIVCPVINTLVDLSDAVATEMMPVDNLYGAAGAGVDMSDLRAFAADPPPNLDVKLVEVEIDGLPAVQVDIEFAR